MRWAFQVRAQEDSPPVDHRLLITDHCSLSGVVRVFSVCSQLPSSLRCVRTRACETASKAHRVRSTHHPCARSRVSQGKFSSNSMSQCVASDSNSQRALSHNFARRLHTHTHAGYNSSTLPSPRSPSRSTTCSRRRTRLTPLWKHVLSR